MNESQPSGEQSETQEAACLKTLQQQKLELEIQKLQGDFGHSLHENKAKVEKLNLEIKDLKRTSWAKPGVMIPIVATLGTIAFAQYQGVFDVKQMRLDLRKDELIAQNRDLTEQQKQLAADVSSVKQDKKKLEDERITLGKDVDSMRESLSRLQTSESEAKARAQVLEGRYTVLYFKIREVVRTEVVSSINDKCGRADKAPSLFSLLGTFASPDKLARDKETAESVFSSSPVTCTKDAIVAAKLLPELAEGDRTYLISRVEEVATALEQMRSQALAAYAKVAATLPADSASLPEIAGAALFLLPKPLSEADAFAWRVRYAKVLTVLRYNMAHSEARKSLAEIRWPVGAAR